MGGGGACGGGWWSFKLTSILLQHMSYGIAPHSSEPAGADSAENEINMDEISHVGGVIFF